MRNARTLLRFASTVGLVGLGACSQITGVKPSSAECHGYAPYDSTYQLASGKDTTVSISRAHLCGSPRVAP